MDMECPRSKPIPPDDLRPPLETISAIYHRVAYGARADFLLPWGEGMITTVSFEGCMRRMSKPR